jgi:hypothetical protein
MVQCVRRRPWRAAGYSGGRGHRAELCCCVHRPPPALLHALLHKSGCFAANRLAYVKGVVADAHVSRLTEAESAPRSKPVESSRLKSSRGWVHIHLAKNRPQKHT